MPGHHIPINGGHAVNGDAGSFARSVERANRRLATPGLIGSYYAIMGMPGYQILIYDGHIVNGDAKLPGRSKLRFAPTGCRPGVEMEGEDSFSAFSHGYIRGYKATGRPLGVART